VVTDHKNLGLFVANKQQPMKEGKTIENEMLWLIATGCKEG
jgi:hypothetical protein